MVVVPARGASVDSQAVEDTVAAIKSARRQLGIDPGQLPIVRLNIRQTRPALVLQTLGLEVESTAQVLHCRRGTDGWPDKLIEECSPGENLLLFVRRASQLPTTEKTLSSRVDPEPPPRRPEEPVPASAAGEVGLLLVYRGSGEREQVKPFLAELGRHWMERYGRVKPSPYPLASYDLSDQAVAEGVARAFPDLVGEKPKAVLCLFLRGRPVRVLETFEELEIPATLVRRISASRRSHLVDTVSGGEPIAAPEARGVELSDRQEETVLLSRVHELAQQLFRGSADPSAENRLAHRAILRIVELTRRDSGAPEMSPELSEAIADFRAEPLLLNDDSPLIPTQNQLLELLELLR